MPKLPFCTCADRECPLNPVNHDRGCDFCVAKCLKAGEIPSCFFHKVSDDLKGHTDWTYAGFAKLVGEPRESAAREGI